MTITTPARNPRIMTPAAAMTRLGSIATGQDVLVASLVDEASAALADALGFAPWRQSYSAALFGRGGYKLQLPIAPVEPGSVTVTHEDEALTGITLDSASGILTRDTAWPDTAAAVEVEWGAGSVGSEQPELAATFTAGWVVPPDLKPWQASLVVTVGDFVKPPWPALLLHEVTVAGTMGASAPTWGTTAGASVTSNGVTLVARNAIELPQSIVGAFVTELLYRFHGRARDPALASRAVPGLSVTWRDTAAECSGALCAQAAAQIAKHQFYGATQ